MKKAFTRNTKSFASLILKGTCFARGENGRTKTPAGRTGCRSHLLWNKEGQKRSDCLPEMLQPAGAVVAAGRTGCRPHPGPGLIWNKEGQKRSDCLPDNWQPAGAVVAAGRTGCRSHLLWNKEGQKRSDCLPEMLQPAGAVVAAGRTGLQPAGAVVAAGRTGCRSHPGPGFTLVELLVVIAIIGTLVGLTIPAVNMARSTARQSQCLNNIRQCTIACVNYNAIERFLPYSRQQYPHSIGNWTVNILSQLEQGEIYEDWTNGETENDPVLGITSPYRKLSVLVCPADPAKLKSPAVDYQAPLSYGANCGFYNGSPLVQDGAVKTADCGVFVSALNNSGKFCRNLRNSVDRISSLDGTSYTVMFAENNQARQWRYVNNNFYDWGVFWFDSFSGTRLFGVGANDQVWNYDHARPSSYHPGSGANVAFVDGHAAYLTAILPQVYSQILAPNDAKTGVASLNTKLDSSAIGAK